MNPLNFLAIDSEFECYGLYDKDKKLIRGWQYGDDITRVLKDILKHHGISVLVTDFEIDGDFLTTLK